MSAAPAPLSVGLDLVAAQTSVGRSCGSRALSGPNPIPISILSVAERVGFEPTAPFGVTGFQDQLLKPLGHLSIVRFYFIHETSSIMVTHPRFERGTP